MPLMFEEKQANISNKYTEILVKIKILFKWYGC